MAEEYSIAMFEDGTTDVIPNSWIQDYLKKDDQFEETKYKIEESNKSSYTILENLNSQLHQQINKAVETTFVEYEKNIKNTLRAINQGVQETSEAVKKLQRKIDCLINIATGDEEPDSDLVLPASNLFDFIAIEDHIHLKYQYNMLMDSLAKIGGKTVEACTRKIWTKLCTTQLASKICWTGANGKFCLKTLTLNELVRDAVLKCHPNGKEAEVQRATMLWFSHAQDRLRLKKSSA